MRALPLILLLGLSSGSLAQNTTPRDGFWETADGRGGAVGIFVSSIGQPYITLGIYQRKGPEIQCLEENFFTTDPKYIDSRHEDVTRYDGSRLQVHFEPKTAGDLPFDIDLTRDPSTNTWSGHFHRAGFDQHVVLGRVDRRDNQGGCSSKVPGDQPGDSPTLPAFALPASTFLSQSFCPISIENLYSLKRSFQTSTANERLGRLWQLSVCYAFARPVGLRILSRGEPPLLPALPRQVNPGLR